MKYLIILFYVAVLAGCLSPVKKAETENSDSKQSSILISNDDKSATSPYFTKDHQNNPVLSWVEGEDENTCLYYAISKDDGETFGPPIQVLPSIGLSDHHESMPKVAFKNDGSVFAIYQRKTPTPENRYAGAIYYTQSFDEGVNWTTPAFLHSDSTAGVGRSFFDIATLPDGEIGAIWLDGRKRQQNGSTLCFAKTKNKEGFGPDMEIGQKTCQCCRTDIYVDEKKNINVAYRDIINDSIRDIVHLVSTDLGNSFSNPKRISVDNWIINGCPHTGPSMVSDKKGLHFFWYTLGGAEGVYRTSTVDQGAHFTERKLFNPHSRHPQSTSLTDNTIALVWDESFKTEITYVNRIGLMLQKPDGSENIEYITSEKVDSSYPVTVGTKNGNILVAWTQRKKGKSKIYYSLISI